MYEYHAEVLKVVDGDTMDLRVDLGLCIYTVIRIRLTGLNTPETHSVSKKSTEYAAGIKAKLRVEELLSLGSTRHVVIKTAKDDKYGRWLADVYIPMHNGEDIHLNQQLLTEGLAVPYDGKSPR